MKVKLMPTKCVSVSYLTGSGDEAQRRPNPIEDEGLVDGARPLLIFDFRIRVVVIVWWLCGWVCFFFLFYFIFIFKSNGRAGVC
jgi:hypothetical protein